MVFEVPKHIGFSLLLPLGQLSLWSLFQIPRKNKTLEYPSHGSSHSIVDGMQGEDDRLVNIIKEAVGLMASTSLSSGCLLDYLRKLLDLARSLHFDQVCINYPVSIPTLWFLNT